MVETVFKRVKIWTIPSVFWRCWLGDRKDIDL